MRAKRQWKPVLSQRYKSQLQLDLFEGAFGSHRIGSTGRVTVEGSAERAASPEGNLKKAGEDRGNLQNENQVTNERYQEQGARLFGRFKRERTRRQAGSIRLRKFVKWKLPPPSQTQRREISKCASLTMSRACATLNAPDQLTISIIRTRSTSPCWVGARNATRRAQMNES